MSKIMLNESTIIEVDENPKTILEMIEKGNSFIELHSGGVVVYVYSKRILTIQ